MEEKEKKVYVDDKELTKIEAELLKQALLKEIEAGFFGDIDTTGMELPEEEEAADVQEDVQDFNVVVSSRVPIKRIAGGADASEESEPYITKIPRTPPKVIDQKPFKVGDIVYHSENGKVGKVLEVLDNLEGYVVVEFAPGGKIELVSEDKLIHEEDYVQPLNYRPPNYIDDIEQTEREKAINELKKSTQPEENLSPIAEKKRKIIKAVEDVLKDPVVSSKIVSELIANGILTVEDIIPRIKMSSVEKWSYRLVIASKIYDFIKEGLLSVDELVDLLKKASQEQAIGFLNEVFESTEDERFKREVLAKFLREVKE
ncbi:MAG: hypothetical protein ABIM32_03920 [candidate division WOR-3 bacterium]